MKAIRWAIALVSLLAVGSASAHVGGKSPLVDHVLKANQRFKNVSVAVAEGYAPIPCASGQQDGAMGMSNPDIKVLDRVTPTDQHVGRDRVRHDNRDGDGRL